MTSDLPRRTIRYWLYRFKNASEGGASSNGAPLGLKEHFESLPGFPGWKKFAESWDVPHLINCKKSKTQFGICSCTRKPIPLLIVGRQFTVQEEWRATIRAEAPILKLKGKHDANQAKVLSRGS